MWPGASHHRKQNLQMAQSNITVLAVCASSLSVSSLLISKIKESLSPLGIEVRVIHLAPRVVEGYLRENPVDLIVTTHPIPGKFEVPMINGTPLLSGCQQAREMEVILQAARAALGSEGTTCW